MKKISFVCISLLFTVYASAQIQFGIKAGLNLTTINFSGLYSSTPGWKSSFDAGMIAAVPLSENFFIQPELMYSGQGFEQSVAGQSGLYELGYLNLPILFKYQHESGLFAETGPQIGFLLHADTEIAGISSNTKDAYQSTDFSWVFGFGYRFTKTGLGIDARYNLGLTNISKNTPGETLKNNAFQFGLFYILNYKKRN
jgi:hypothetical protein